MQTLEMTASGYLGGMPLRLLTGYRPELIATRLALQPVPVDRPFPGDARDLAPWEVTYLPSADPPRRDHQPEPGELPDGPL